MTRLSGGTLSWLAVPLLVIAALVAPFSHDETQYLAASALVLEYVPYRDFIYLQTPLQAWLGAGIVAVSPGWALVASRIAQALVASGAIAILAATARRHGDARAARRAILFGLASYPFVFSATVVRNDIVPMFLECVAVALLLGVAGKDRPDRARLAAAGLCICLAASAKVTFGLIGAGVLGWLVFEKRWSWGDRFIAAAALGAGAFAGLLPTLAGAWPAPGSFVFDVITFGAKAPLHWYELTGEAWRTYVAGRGFDAAVVLLQGPLLVGVLVSMRSSLRKHGPKTDALRLIDWLVLAALVASLVPNPVWRQYFVPLVPPVVLRLAIGGLPEGRVWKMLLSIGLVAGIASSVVRVGSGTWRGTASIFVQTKSAHRLGEILERCPANGPVATLSPQLAIDAGARLDPAFAAGPFVWRWSDPARASDIVGAQGLTAAAMARHFAARPPIAIVTGFEGGDRPGSPTDLDLPLDSWAKANGYRLLAPGPAGERVHLSPACR